MPYGEKTIVQVVEDIDKKKYYLPAIQRKYVWKEEQIVKLMDSIMRGYPFGTFLFWKVKKITVNEKAYSLYEFIKNYHDRDKSRNEPAMRPFPIAEGHEDEMILSVLDGQQRLTSLYIGLMGSMSRKVLYGRWNNNKAFPRKELYFDLHSSDPDCSEDDDIKYTFRFLTDAEASESNNNEIWYKVKDILKYSSLTELNKLVLKAGWFEDEIATDNITLLFQKIKAEKLINYFEVESDDIDDVLDIFVRINSGGTTLSKTDLLFSTIVSYWDEGREKIDDLIDTINKIGDHYKFTSDFIMRICLYVMDLPVSLKVENFKGDNVRKIKDSWDQISKAIRDTVELLNELGFSNDNIVSANSIIPIVYYRYKYGDKAFQNDVEKMEIRKYMVISQIRHIFGQSTNTTLSSIRKELMKHDDKFRLSHLQKLTFTGDLSLTFDEDDIDNWFDTFEKDSYTFMLLSLLYPNLKYSQNGFHQDHLHPYSAFENKDDLKALKLPAGRGIMDSDKIDDWRHKRNTLANLQLLEGKENKSKNAVPFDEWIKEPANEDNAKFIPKGIDYSLANFDEFIEMRKKLMVDEIKKILL